MSDEIHSHERDGMTSQYSITESIDPSLVSQGKELLLQAQRVVQVETEAQFQQASQIGQALHIHIQQLKGDLDRVLKPALSFEKVVRRIWKDNMDPEIEAKARIANLAANFKEKERKLLEEQERAKLVEFNRLEAERLEALRQAQQGTLTQQINAEQKAERLEAESRAVILAPTTAPVAAFGSRTKAETDFEILDVQAAYSANPHLFFPPEPRRQVIKAMPLDAKLPGIRLFSKTTTHFTR